MNNFIIFLNFIIYKSFFFDNINTTFLHCFILRIHLKPRLFAHFSILPKNIYLPVLIQKLHKNLLYHSIYIFIIQFFYLLVQNYAILSYPLYLANLKSFLDQPMSIRNMDNLSISLNISKFLKINTASTTTTFYIYNFSYNTK